MAKKKNTFFKKFMIISGVIILIQGASLFYFKKQVVIASDFKSTVDAGLEARGYDEETKSRIKLDLAIVSYRMKFKKLPESLTSLIPEFIDRIPLDPVTGIEYAYTAKGEFYTIGSSSDSEMIDAGELSPEQRQEVLIASLDQKDASKSFHYNPEGKRDPFKSFDFSPIKTVPIGNSPLEQHEYSELKLTAVLLGMDEPKAIVEDPQGKGHTVKVGDHIGPFGGTVVKIEATKVLVLESVIEFTGEKKTRTVEMFLRR